MILSVEEHHPFRVGDVLLDATGEASFVEQPAEPRLGLYRRTQAWGNTGFKSLVYPVTILAREGEPVGWLVEKETVQTVTITNTPQFVVRSGD